MCRIPYLFMMRMCAAVSMVTCVTSYAQQFPLKEQFIAYQQWAPQEKLFVHTDKSFYLTGETIWFKIYHIDGSSHKPIDLSKVAYVELLDHEGKAMLQAKIGLGTTNGNGNGSLVLPAYLASGNYMMRAYTQWMRNFDQAYFFQKNITVVNTSKRPDWQALEKKEEYRAQLFPEGGNLVDGLKSRVGIHVTDQYGKGIEGDIEIRFKEETVVRFKTSQQGIGSFDFVPKSSMGGQDAVVSLGNGKVISTRMPEIYRNGYVMHVEEMSNDKLKVTITTNVDRPPMVYLLGHTRQVFKFAERQSFSNGIAEWTIGKSALGEGVSVLTVFNESRQPLCERLYFKKPSEKLNIDITTDQKNYNTRSKVSMGLLAQNEKGAAVKSDLSVSVFLLDSLQSMDQQTIEHYFWLTSDLTGKVESPAHYFSEPSAEITKATDDLMLTHGWRRFRWENVTSGNGFAAEFLPEYEGLTINARVTDKQGGRPARGVLSYLSFADQQFQVSNAVSNNDGRAVFVTRDVFGPHELVLQADSNSNRYQVELSSSFAALTPEMRNTLKLPQFKLPGQWKDQLADRLFNSSAYSAYQPVTVGQFLMPSTNDTSLFYGEPDKRFFLDDYTRFPTMEEVLREYVEAVRIRKDSRGKFYCEVMNLPSGLHFNTQPLLLLDGVPVFNTDKLIAFDPLKIKKIEVVGRKYYWGNLTCNGIVSFSTYEGDLAGYELDPAALVVEFQGLQLQREFHHPDYSTPDNKASRIPDTRNVLYWQSDISTGIRSVENSFYTSDIPGNYVIVVQGLSSDGVAGSKVLMMAVRN